MNAQSAADTSSNPILVTGAHRTGTTWVGKMLAAGGQAAYISEPLNVLHRPGVLRVPIKHWYTYICEENEDQFLPALFETLRFRYHPLAEARSLRSRKDALRMARDSGIFLAGKIRNQRPLLKDPFAVFSAGWFAKRLGCQVIITVRHPAAFAGSLKRLDWPFDFADLLAQPLLMRDWLEPYRNEMETLRKRPDEVIAQGALLWKMVYTVVDRLRQAMPQIQVVRHEDLSLDPVAGFRSLYAAAELRFTPAVEQAILKSSSAENPKEGSRKSVHSVRLDSRANLETWKRRLDPQEVWWIRELTADIAARYYPELDWD